jgi:hypothetical protein
VADLLGITVRRRALQAITAGDASAASFAALDDGWDVEERARAELGRFSLPSDAGALDRTVGTLSGGEAVLAGVAGMMLRRAEITLLDEPTNNLDRGGRARRYAARTAAYADCATRCALRPHTVARSGSRMLARPAAPIRCLKRDRSRPTHLAGEVKARGPEATPTMRVSRGWQPRWLRAAGEPGTKSGYRPAGRCARRDQA